MRALRGPLVGVLASFVLASCVVARAPAQTTIAGTVVEHVIDAPALAGNLIGDAERKRVLVYLPPGYDADLGRRFPTIYLLHGIFTAPDWWVGGVNVPSMMDRGVSRGDFPPAIVVMPDGSNRVGGGYYRDSPVTGDWGRFIAGDLVAWVDSAFRTIPDREGRAVVGHSMGGYGALHLGMERADVFATVWGMSPCCLAPVADLGQGNTMWQTVINLRDWAALDRAVAAQSISGLYTAALLGVAMAWADVKGQPPFYVTLPFAVRRGETVVKDAAHAAWAGEFPVHRIDERRAALASLRGIGFGYGIDEQFAHIPAGTRQFADRLAEHRIPFEFDVYRGDHRIEVASRLETAVLPFVFKHLRTQ